MIIITDVKIDHFAAIKAFRIHEFEKWPKIITRDRKCFFERVLELPKDTLCISKSPVLISQSLKEAILTMDTLVISLIGWYLNESEFENAPNSSHCIWRYTKHDFLNKTCDKYLDRFCQFVFGIKFWWYCILFLWDKSNCICPDFNWIKRISRNLKKFNRLDLRQTNFENMLNASFMSLFS